MSNDEMIAQCVIFFIAGYETTATALSLATYCLALNPEIQEQLYREIETELAKLQSEPANKKCSNPLELITFESLSKFEYLNAVLSETLRLYPPAPFLNRRAKNDIQLESPDGKYRINVKANDIINIPTFAIHHDPEQFPEPDMFRPERFIGEPSHHKYSYLPFGSGPRNCVARSLALLEAKLALLHVVRMFKFSKCKQTMVKKSLHDIVDF